MLRVASLFPSGTLPIVLSDSPYVRTKFSECGFRVLDSNSDFASVKEAIFIPTDEERALSQAKIEHALGSAAVLVIPLMAFSSDNSSVDYLVKRLAELDFASACSLSAERVGLIEKATKPVQITSEDGSSMLVTIGNQPEVFLPKLEPSIAYGEWAVISQFLEVALIPNEENSSFIVDGSILCDGVSVAFHSENWIKARPSALAAWNILRAVRIGGGFPIALKISESRVKSITTAAGEQILPKISPLTDVELQERLIEMSFASAPASDSIDWSINSQINEASGGVHLALGTGVAAAHIDFIASKACVMF